MNIFGGFIKIFRPEYEDIILDYIIQKKIILKEKMKKKIKNFILFYIFLKKLKLKTKKILYFFINKNNQKIS